MSAANLRMNNKRNQYRNQYHLICRVISICLCALFCLSFGCTSKKEERLQEIDFTVVDDDEIPEEREAALQIGMILLTLCDVLVVCGPYISAGMAGEIKAAFEKGKEVYWYDGIKYPGELIKIENWREINDEVQIHT